MGDIINLNKQRKARARAGKDAQASANRAKYGRTKQEKDAEQRRKEKLALHVDGHKRDTPEE